MRKGRTRKQKTKEQNESKLKECISMFFMFSENSSSNLNLNYYGYQIKNCLIIEEISKYMKLIKKVNKNRIQQK